LAIFRVVLLLKNSSTNRIFRRCWISRLIGLCFFRAIPSSNSSFFTPVSHTKEGGHI
jgi:hypothetical protein